MSLKKASIVKVNVRCIYRTFRSISVVILGQDYCLNSGQERMDSMKSWAGIEEGKAGRSVCCVMHSVRVLVMCCGIVLHMLVCFHVGVEKGAWR